MKSSEFIIEVTEADFEYQVIAYSQKIPVLVDFWAEWCIPCRTLGPLLERLAEEARGGFRLAKVDVDSNPNLSRRYNVRSIPMVKAFRDGGLVSEFVGALPEARVRDFIREIAPAQTDLMLEKAHSLMQMRQYESAEKTYRQYLLESPRRPAAMLGLIKSLLLQGKIAESQQLLLTFPDSKELAAAETLKPLANVLELVKRDEAPTEDPVEAAYANALRLVMRGNLHAAMDGVLDVLRQDKHYRDDEARQVMVGLLELMGAEDPQTRQYRNEFASVLF